MAPHDDTYFADPTIVSHAHDEHVLDSHRYMSMASPRKAATATEQGREHDRYNDENDRKEDNKRRQDVSSSFKYPFMIFHMIILSWKLLEKSIYCYGAKFFI